MCYYPNPLAPWELPYRHEPADWHPTPIQIVVEREKEVPPPEENGVRLFRSGRYWVAHCTFLNVASQGNTPTEARANLAEAVVLFLETCREMGTLDKVICECVGLSQGGDD